MFEPEPGMSTATQSKIRTAIDVRDYAAIAHYVALGVVFLIGAWLRLTALNRQSLWFDEADVVIRAQQPLSRVMETFVAPGENGPIYNIMLALWIRFAGISEIAVRLPSAVFGVIALPLVYLLARRIAGSTVALIATGLLAISPYHIWYSQEAKMYTMVVALALASTYALVVALERNQRWWWIAYAVVTTLMFYTHVATILVFGAQFLYAVATWREWPARRRSWAIAISVLTLPYIPIALWAMRVIGGQADTWHPAVTLPAALETFAIKFAVDRYEDDIRIYASILYAVLAVAGIAGLAYWRRREKWWLLISLLVVVPIIGLWVVSLQQSVFSDRYGIVALPFYLILVSAALGWTLRRQHLWPLAVVAMIFLISFAWAPIRDVNRTQSAEKEDWRSAYAWVAERHEPGDALVVMPGYLITTWDYHLQRDERLENIHGFAMGSFTIDWFDESDMMHIMYEEAEGAERIWLVQSPDRAEADDPDLHLESWLENDGEAVAEHEVNGVQVTLYKLEEPLSRW
jgi:mannosyltransferase